MNSPTQDTHCHLILERVPLQAAEAAAAAAGEADRLPAYGYQGILWLFRPET